MDRMVWYRAVLMTTKKDLKAVAKLLEKPDMISEAKKEALVARSLFLQMTRDQLTPWFNDIEADVATAVQVTVHESMNEAFQKTLDHISKTKKSGEPTHYESGWNAALDAVSKYLNDALAVNKGRHDQLEKVIHEEHLALDSKWFWTDDVRDGWNGHFDLRQEAIDDAIEAGVEEIELACFVPDQSPDDPFEYTVAPVHLTLLDEDGVPLPEAQERKRKRKSTPAK